uniref:Uncharacterized protein n=1 Tax=Proboscia inermis TaxID=420281 RepID=A0A7S0BX49_9STRA|mmetsp:Transcript_13967/g.14147  ORF Transcript_13967/g.14147 Transcript_13967/m.14147 type:complete len:210 (+) Transcript_13967:148-777(+)
MPRPRPKRLPFAELFFQPHAHDDHSNTHTPNKKGGLIGRDVPPPYGFIAAELDMETKDADDVFDLFNEKEVPSPRSSRTSTNTSRANPKPEKKRSNSRLDSASHKENDYPPAGNPPESRYAQNPQSSPETGPQYPHPYHPYPSPSEHGAHPLFAGVLPPRRSPTRRSPAHATPVVPVPPAVSSGWGSLRSTTRLWVPAEPSRGVLSWIP